MMEGTHIHLFGERSQHLTSAGCSVRGKRLRAHSRVHAWWIAVLVLSLVGSIPAQTLQGQNGSFTTPSADTYPAGNFSVGSYFRSTCFQPTRYDATSVYLITGISPTTEASFSFPGIWGNDNLPSHFMAPANASIKQQVYATKKKQFRVAVDGFMQRNPIDPDSTYSATADWGLGVIASGNYERNTYHVFFNHLIARDNVKTVRDIIGAGLDRAITEKLLFSADFYGTSSALMAKKTDLTSILGVRYQLNPNFQVSGGGGIGITGGSFDWQYVLGLSFTTDLKKISYTSFADFMPPMPGGGDALPGSNISGLNISGANVSGPNVTAGIPPPGSPEAEPQPTRPTNGKSVIKKQPLIYTRLFFDENRYAMSEAEQQNFGMISKEIKKIGREQCLTMVGHCDQIGSDRENYALAMARALYVAGQIIDSTGVPAENLIIGGVGKERLSDLRETQTAYQLNRRVELRTCERLSTQLDTLPDDSCTITQPIKLKVGNAFSPAGFDELSNQLDNCLTKLGTLKSDEFLVLAPRWNSEVDPKTCVYLTSMFWLYAVETNRIQPSKSFIKLRSSPLAPGDKPGVVEEPSLIAQLVSEHNSAKNIHVRLKLNGQKTLPKGSTVIVAAKVNDKLVLANGETIAIGKVPDSKKLKRSAIRGKGLSEFTFPLTEAEQKLASYQVFVFDTNGKYLGNTPAVPQTIATHWKNRFAEALNLKDADSNSGAVLQISIRKYRNQDQSSLGSTEK